MSKNICAVVVTYFPESYVIKNINTLLKQVDRVIVVDNTKKQNTKFFEVLDKNERVQIIYNGENLGIAKALNQGCKIALKAGYKWILTMDQDSTPSKNMTKNMIEAYNKFLDKGSVWAISPVIVDNNTGYQENFSETTEYTIIETAITSGMLVKSEALSKFGLFKEKYFIYHVDTEYCLRLRLNNQFLIRSNKSILYHNEGNFSEHSFLWKKNILTTNHSPISRYYMSRNLVLMFREYPKEFLYFFNTFTGYLMMFVKTIIFEKDRVKKVSFFLKGFWDGLLNKYGEFKP